MDLEQNPATDPQVHIPALAINPDQPESGGPGQPKTVPHRETSLSLGVPTCKPKRSRVGLTAFNGGFMGFADSREGI
jgi:hypothetical protein